MRTTIVQVYSRRAALLGAMTLLIGALACDEVPSSPGSEPEIANETDSFAYQVTGVRSYSGSDFYTWENTGATASVDISSAPESGSALIVMTDAEGQHVFAEPVSSNGSLPSAAGTAGSWTIRVYYASFTGNVNFRVQKKT